MMTRLNEAAQHTGKKRSRLETARRADAAMTRLNEAAQQTGKKRSRLETARRADAVMTRLNKASEQTEKEAKPFGDGAESRCCDDTLE